MKATGIVRRIDDLGRIVIPKEIRRTLFIREGDPLEIYVDGDGEIIFKKYSPVKEMGAFAKDIVDGISKASGDTAVVFDRDSAVAGAGISKRELEGMKISSALKDACDKRISYVATETSIPAFEGEENYSVICSSPIIADGEVSGCVALLGSGDISARNQRNDDCCARESELKLVSSASYFLGKQLSS